MKPNLVKVFAIAFVIGTGIMLSYFLVGLPFVLIFLVTCADELIFGKLVRMKYETGMELQTFATLLAAIIYGPWMALIFGVFFIQIILGVLGIILWGFDTPALDVGWAPLIPSPDTLTIGLAGFVAGYAYLQFGSIILTGVAMVIFRTIFQLIKEFFYGGAPRLLAYVLNTILTMALLITIQQFIPLLM